MNNDVDYCAYGCPAGKRCPPAAADSCAIGTPRLRNQGTPLCCEVEDDAVYLRTVQAVHRAPSYNNDPDVAAFKQRLGAMLAFLHIPNQGGGSLFAGWTLDLVVNDNAPACTLQRTTDLIRLLVKVRRRSLVEICAEIFTDLPPDLRNNDSLAYAVHAAEYHRDRALPSLVSHGKYTFHYDTPISAHQFFSLVLLTLERQPGVPQRRSEIALSCTLNNDGSTVTRRQMNLLTHHVRNSLFSGEITASISNFNVPLFEAGTPLQTTTVAQGRTITAGADDLMIRII